MTDLRTARMLTRYTLWADRVMFDAVAALPSGEPEKERKTLFKSMIGTLNHNLVVDLIWQAHVERREHGFAARNAVLHPDLAGLRQAQEKMDAWWIAWADAQSPASLAERLAFSFIGGPESVMTAGEMMLHVVTHKSYHRGWVAEMFFQVPTRPPAMDLPVFLRDVPRDWE